MIYEKAGSMILEDTMQLPKEERVDREVNHNPIRTIVQKERIKLVSKKKPPAKTSNSV